MRKALRRNFLVTKLLDDNNTVATRISTRVCSEALYVWWLTFPTWWDYSHHGNKALRNLDLVRDFLDQVNWPRMTHSKWSRLNPKEKASWIQHIPPPRLLPDWGCMWPTASYPSHHSPDCEPTWTLPSSGSFGQLFVRAMRQVAEAICCLCSHDFFISLRKYWIFFFRVTWLWILLSYGILN